MPELLPVNVAVDTLHAAVKAAQGSQPPGLAPADSIKIPAPADLAQWEQESYELDSSLALTLGFPLGHAKGDGQVQTMLFGMARYKDVYAGDHTYRYGVALRVLLEIHKFDANFDLSLPVIAAEVQLGSAGATSQMLVSGYVGDIASELPPWQSFDVKTYTAYIEAINSLQKQIFGDTTNMRSTLLGSTVASQAISQPAVQSKPHWLHW